MSDIDFKEIFKIYRSKIFAALGAVIFILSGLVLYEFKFAGELYSDDKNNAQTRTAANSEHANNNIKMSSSEDVDYKNYTYDSDYNKSEELLNLYITGSVRKPGVYKLPPKSRIFNLVEAAGGLNSLADREAVNLVELLSDGEHIHIPSKSESKKSSEIERRENKDKKNILIMEAEIKNNYKAQTQSKSQNKSQNKSSKREKYYERVNINTANAAELEKLRGIGPALAKRIIDYRTQHGAFKSVNDLIKVRGIGSAKLKGLMDQAFIN